ncbi:MAG: hypothetical protein ACK2T2_14005 [Anaerolineales bacterium]|jgi:hypothetical protein
MSFNQFLPFVSTVVMLIFTVSVFQRYAVRRKPHFLFWGIGLAMFGAGSFAEAYFSVFGWSALVFFLWYFFGAALNAGWIGHGTLMLLVRKRWRNVVTAILIIGSLVAAVLMFQAMARLNPANYQAGVPISEQYRDIMPAVDAGGAVRLTTPFFNVYGLITLVGGALWSAWLFLRKRVLPNRVVGNVLIAAGALSIGFASTLTRMGYGQLLYLGELIAAILMYVGFVMAGRPEPAVEKEAVASTVPVAT